MPEPQPLDEASPAVHKHLDIMQGVIGRMAAGSRSAKTWCVTVVAAILIVAARGDVPGCAILFALIPAAMFCTMDAYYLGLERGFRGAYDKFVGKLHAGTLTPGDLYVVNRDKTGWRLWLSAFLSFSVWGFYAAIAISIFLAQFAV